MDFNYPAIYLLLGLIFCALVLFSTDWLSPDVIALALLKVGSLLTVLIYLIAIIVVPRVWPLAKQGPPSTSSSAASTHLHE